MPHLPQRSPRVLVIDDDDAIQQLIDCMLSDAGFAVSVASTARAALDLLELDMLERDKFNLLVTDMTLPDGLNGLDVVRYARARNSSLKSLFISGFNEPVWDDPDLDDFVSKPFSGRELLGCVWELLSRDLPKKQLAGSFVQLAELAIVEAKVNCLHTAGWPLGSLKSPAPQPPGKTARGA